MPYVVALIIGVVVILVLVAEEEVYGSTLDLGRGVEARHGDY